MRLNIQILKKGGTLNMEISLEGLDFAAAEREVEESRKPLPESDYQFRIDSVEHKIGQASGRPYLNWTMVVINHSEYSNKKFFYSTPLPWVNPQTQKLESTGLNFLVDLCKAVGKPWSGGKLLTEMYIGAIGSAKIGIKLDQNGRPQNEVKAIF